MSLHRFGDWTPARCNARLNRATEPPMIPRLLSFAAVVLCAAWVPAPPDPLAADPDVEAVERGPAIGEAELAPYFTTSAAKSALSELQAGRAANALRFLPRRPADAPTRWLKALALKAADHPKAARALFEQLAMEGGPLADRALHMAALCAIDQGSAGAAEMLLDAHRNREALDQLARIMVPSLCLGGCPGDRSAGGFLKAALGALGAYPEQHQPTPEDVDLTPVEPGDPLACRVKLDEGRAFRKEREYSRARAALAQVVLRCAEPDVRSRALYVLAQLETISGKATARPLGEALARKYPQSTLADDAVYNQGVAARRNGELDKERALLQDLVNRFPSSDLRSDALFRLFWSHW